MALDGILSFADGQVRLGDALLPGILKSLTIDCSVDFDEGKKDGLSGKKKTPKGWEDANISVELWLLTDDDSTCYDKLAELNGHFRGFDNGANPKVLTLVNSHVKARGIRQVVFAGLQSAETEETDEIFAQLTFREHNPPVVVAEKRAVASDQAKGASAAAPATKPASGAEKAILVDVG